MNNKYLSSSALTTKRLAAFLAQEILKSEPYFKNALIIGLSGSLGSGKTTFIQGFARGLGVKQRLPSPTFLIVRNYKLSASRRTKNYKLLYHVDCYRLEKPKELTALGFKEIAKNRHNIVLIEWADKIKKILPKDKIWLKFGYGKKENQRIIIIRR